MRAGLFPTVFVLFVVLILAQISFEQTITKDEDPGATSVLRASSRKRKAKIRQLKQNTQLRKLTGRCGVDGADAYSCCVQLGVSTLGVDETICARLALNKEDKGIDTAITLNGASIYEDSISGLSAPSMCIPMPNFPAITLCLVLRRIQPLENKLSVCTTLEVRFAGRRLAGHDFDCLQVPLNLLPKMKKIMNRH